MIGSNSLDVVFLRFLAADCGVLLPRFRCLFCVVRATFEELFSEVGDLKRYSVHYDRSGRSEGTTEMVFARQEDAVSAINRYSNVQLDGKPLKIEIVGTNIAMLFQVSLDFYEFIARNSENCGRVLPRQALQGFCNRSTVSLLLFMEVI